MISIADMGMNAGHWRPDARHACKTKRECPGCKEKIPPFLQSRLFARKAAAMAAFFVSFLLRNSFEDLHQLTCILLEQERNDIHAKSEFH